MYLPTTHTVCAKTSLGNQRKQARIGICLDSIMHLIVGIFLDGFANGTKRLLQSVQVVIIERRVQLLEAIYGKSYL